MNMAHRSFAAYLVRINLPKMMAYFTILCFPIIIVHSESQLLNNVVNKNKTFVYNTYKYDVNNTIVLNASTEHILDFYEDTDDFLDFPTRFHVSTVDDLDNEHPVFFTATQQREMSSWKLPHSITGESFYTDMACTLCPHEAQANTPSPRPTLHITTTMEKNISIIIKLRRVTDFYLEVDKELTLSVKPSTPKYYYFSFDKEPGIEQILLPKFNYTIPKSIIISIDSPDDDCAIISVQNRTCPVFDNEVDVLYRGYRFTMTRKGGITLSQSMFPNGFYLVFIVKESDETCTRETGTEMDNFIGGNKTDDWLIDDDRIKQFKFRINSTISYSQYALVACLTMVAILSFAIGSALLLYFDCIACPFGRIQQDLEVSESISPLTNEEIDSESINTREAHALNVGHLSRIEQNARDRKSAKYVWNTLTFAMVYALPVFQLLVMYQRLVYSGGNADLCYYNYLCAHPFGSLVDFNHVYSNLGYVVLGVTFAVMVKKRQVAFGARETGIPPHWSLLYSLALALVMEGFLSACYHLCPNKMNFQFDSSFMYVTAVLCCVSLYQRRHPDVNAHAHTVCLAMALLLCLGVLGIMFPSTFYWCLFTFLHLGTCLFLTLKIYYLGDIVIDRQGFIRACRRLRNAEAYKPKYMTRAILLGVANAINWAIAIYGFCNKIDLARHLLAILLGNAVLYMIFYVVMKLVYKERIYIYTWLYIILAHILWGVAVYYFLHSGTRWSQTPAMSRRRNSPCILMDTYDSHDIWHLTSSMAIFLSYNVLLYVDDDLLDVPRNLIPVF